MKKLSILTIVLILLSLYLIGLSCLEFYASSQSGTFADKMFEQNLNYSSASLMKLFSQNITSIESNEWKIAQNEDRIVNLENEVSNNWWIDTYVSWNIRAKMHFIIGLLTVLVTILSWRIDNLKRI